MGLIVSAPQDPDFITTTVVNSSPYNILISDVILLVDTSSVRVLNLPNPAVIGKHRFWIKDATGSASTNPMTLTPFGAETIDGTAGTRPLAASWGQWQVVCDGTNWYLL